MDADGGEGEEVEEETEEAEEEWEQKVEQEEVEVEEEGETLQGVDAPLSTSPSSTLMTSLLLK